jgi:hypothetical protein
VGAEIFLSQDNVQNRQVATFVLGPCNLLNAYAIGFFIANQQVATIPDPNNPILQASRTSRRPSTTRSTPMIRRAQAVGQLADAN